MTDERRPSSDTESRSGDSVDEERETGVSCPCQDSDPHTRPKIEGVCPVCKGRGWLTVTEWRAAKEAGLLKKP